MTQLVDLYTTENMHKILSNWYGQEAKLWNISEDLVLLVYQMIVDSKSCTTTFNYVPRPSGPIGAARSLTSVAISEIKSVIKNLADDEHAIACLKTIAWKKRSQVTMAKDGI